VLAPLLATSRLFSLLNAHKSTFANETRTTHRTPRPDLPRDAVREITGEFIAAYVPLFRRGNHKRTDPVKQLFERPLKLPDFRGYKGLIEEPFDMSGVLSENPPYNAVYAAARRIIISTLLHGR